MMLFRQITYITYLTWGKHVYNSILFKIKCKLSSASIDYIKNLNLYK